MKKTVSVNLNGQVFTIDEDAYRELQSYLDAVAGQFSNSIESDEIISDVEARIAELFASYITSAKQSITIGDVQKVIEIMGKPNDYVQDEEQKNNRSYNNQSYSQHDGRYKRRLYRDPDNRIIGGVASGIAAWADIDPVIIRVIFVITFFIFGPLLYLVLWIIIPIAKTPSQRLEMRGEEVNLNNIERIIKEEFQQVKESLRNLKKKETGQRIRTEVSSTIGNLMRLLIVISKIFIGLLLAITIFVFLLFLGVMFKIIPVDFVGFHCNGAQSFHLFLKSMVSESSATMLFWGILLFVGSILLSIIVNTAKILTGNGRRWWLINSIFTVTTITGLVFIIVGAVHEADYFDESSQMSYKTVIPKISDTLYLSVNKSFIGKSNNWNYESNKDFNFPFGKNTCEYKHGTLSMYGSPKIQIMQSVNDSLYMEIIKKANGNTIDNAKSNAQTINYTWQIHSNIILFDDVFSVVNGTWRNQKVAIVLYVPEHCWVYIKNESEGLIENIEANRMYIMSNGLLQ